MDDKRGECGAAGLPADFVPLRLRMQGTNSILELERPDMVLGRHSEADVRLPLPDVSRRHCRFSFRSGSWRVRDLKSLNGTFLNNFPIEEAQVQNGDLLRIGGFTFTVDLPAVRPTHPEKEMVLPIRPLLPTLCPESEPDRRAS